MSRVTIKDIARAAGVSMTAVSFAFNDPDRLSKATHERILRVAEELGYTPHPVARSLSKGRTGVIGVLAPQDIVTMLENPFFAQFLHGIGQVCVEEEGTMLLTAPIRGSLQAAIDRAMVDGFVVIGLGAQDPAMELLQRRGTPFVLVDSECCDGIPCVNVDDQAGARAVMQHVLNHGHRRVAILGFESGESGDWRRWRGAMRWRLEGYSEALATVGLAPGCPEVSILECENTLEGGEQAFRGLWEEAPRPTAMVAMSDLIALGILGAARAQGVEVPRQLSIVGYDDIPEAKHAAPALTTVYQPSVEKGERAAELLMRLLHGEAADDQLTLPTSLVARASVARPPS